MVKQGLPSWRGAESCRRGSAAAWLKPAWAEAQRSLDGERAAVCGVDGYGGGHAGGALAEQGAGNHNPKLAAALPQGNSSSSFENRHSKNRVFALSLGAIEIDSPGLLWYVPRASD